MNTILSWILRSPDDDPLGLFLVDLVWLFIFVGFPLLVWSAR